ncbi:MAG TPA: NIL domain-containing protein [Atribacter sp.]|jgi:ferredoxin|uniref:Anaerobic sulfite reductase subunit C n=1 Tax=Candidatus Atribacter allofermentans TaxID=1852833 RepID=A0A1V5SVE5_9BACT|nr:NIL domain-containing protein [Atribacter sp.]MDD3713945.1 NIL domain-containing protein [Atribacterota bacterium]OQA58510.1 MAG: Anaerobic sulfite reductase subunit C [Candidatus Atribacteria bacterium ADurb.Bin276]HHT10801.1 4Fe-4S binding protein [Candidatus Atribacteria bacterium]MDI9593766.1 NIL domain-containing protein [Atribacterota bacterium]HQK83833.1 NIL domain-containing protein [Atribacter sp.]
MVSTKKVVLHFPREAVERPVVCDLALRFGLTFNILRASISPHHEGLMVLEIIGENTKNEEGLKYLQEKGVEIQPLSQDIKKDDQRCIDCGSCLGVCPTSALYMDKKSYQVIFEESKCIACELCVLACPTRAMEALF